MTPVAGYDPPERDPPSCARFLPAIARAPLLGGPCSFGVPSVQCRRHAAPIPPHRKRAPMPDIDPALPADPALLTAEDMLAAFARRQLTPVDVLQAITERV